MSKRKGQAKLTSAIVEAIRNAKEWRGIVTALAMQYGVSHSMISMIRAGKRWTADPMTEERFKPDGLYAMHGSVLNAIWRDIYLPLITDDGTPTTAIKATAAATWRSVSARCSKAMQSRWKRNEYGPFISSDWRRPNERAAFRGTLQIESHGRELSEHETRRVAERAWQNFLRYGWLMHTTPHQIHVGRGQRTANISTNRSTNSTRILIPNGAQADGGRVPIDQRRGSLWKVILQPRLKSGLFIAQSTEHNQQQVSDGKETR